MAGGWKRIGGKDGWGEAAHVAVSKDKKKERKKLGNGAEIIRKRRRRTLEKK